MKLTDGIFGIVLAKPAVSANSWGYFLIFHFTLLPKLAKKGQFAGDQYQFTRVVLVNKLGF